MLIKKWSLAACCLLLFFACTQQENSLIVGKWKATILTREGVVMPIDLSTIQIHLKADNIYEYSGANGQMETGKYTFSGDTITLFNAAKPDDDPRVMGVPVLTNDSMFFLMSGGARTMKFVRLKE